MILTVPAADTAAITACSTLLMAAVGLKASSSSWCMASNALAEAMPITRRSSPSSARDVSWPIDLSRSWPTSEAVVVAARAEAAIVLPADVEAAVVARAGVVMAAMLAADVETGDVEAATDAADRRATAKARRARPRARQTLRATHNLPSFCF
mmetsp:Transcript_57418/g.113972  ORF Transcript_57418/g.113972 Transcript_57418/m.113972 type:complete len:153 (+) Transcript_57418:36-494(+)